MDKLVSSYNLFALPGQIVQVALHAHLHITKEASAYIS